MSITKLVARSIKPVDPVSRTPALNIVVSTIKLIIIGLYCVLIKMRDLKSDRFYSIRGLILWNIVPVQKNYQLFELSWIL